MQLFESIWGGYCDAASNPLGIRPLAAKVRASHNKKRWGHHDGEGQ